MYGVRRYCRIIRDIILECRTRSVWRATILEEEYVEEGRTERRGGKRSGLHEGALCCSGCRESIRMVKGLVSINHVYSSPLSQVTVVHCVNARVYVLPFPHLPSFRRRFLSSSLTLFVPEELFNRPLMGVSVRGFIHRGGTL